MEQKKFVKEFKSNNLSDLKKMDWNGPYAPQYPYGYPQACARDRRPIYDSEVRKLNILTKWPTPERFCGA